ncbi:MAG: GntR family transcriptional regulator [Peptoniphilaceae bacterium]|nr:GntR family transcriptional regulator [Peptoniphilaceae bacterium]MDY6085414.1 GntR family transcriptional regulator [Peptoniphilaceae bacterium]
MRPRIKKVRLDGKGKELYEEETLSEQVYLRLLDELKSGTWEIGQHLNEKRIAESLHVSRTPVRWALKRIADSGLLEYDKNLGYRVKLITEKDVREIYKIRKALEILAFQEAALHMTDEDYRQIRAIVEASRQAVAEEDLGRLMMLATRFNKRVYEAARMPRLVLVQMELQSVLWSFRSLSFEAAISRRELAVEEHAQLLEAMHRQEVDRIPELISIHLSRSQSYILQVLQEKFDAATEASTNALISFAQAQEKGKGGLSGN